MTCLLSYRRNISHNKKVSLISQEIGGSGEHLATQLGRLTKWQEILHNPTYVDKVVNLLFESISLSNLEC